jgi:OFA family oxalate/formate antiporter-like MFS transporter
MTVAARTAAGAVLIAFVLGSLHAFSVLIEPVERQLGASRATVSLVYSLATVALICGVFVCGRLLLRCAPPVLALVSALVCAGGLVLAGIGSSLVLMFVGFGVLFGFANGIGYALSIERAGVAWPGRKGLLTGLVTAAYCGGAIVFSKVFAIWALPQTYQTGLYVLAGVIAVAGLTVWMLLSGGAKPHTQQEISAAGDLTAHQAEIIQLWLIYFLGVMAGMMALGHAAAVVSATGGTLAAMTAGAMIVSAGSAGGSVVSGWLADRLRPRCILTGCLVLVFASMVVLAATGSPAEAIIGLGLTGFAYGALITIIPVITASDFAPGVSLAVFGRVFTAWGVAGLAGPWLGGYVFDISRSYTTAFVVAAAAALLASVLSLWYARKLPVVS